MEGGVRGCGIMLFLSQIIFPLLEKESTFSELLLGAKRTVHDLRVLTHLILITNHEAGVTIMPTRQINRGTQTY